MVELPQLIPKQMASNGSILPATIAGCRCRSVLQLCLHDGAGSGEVDVIEQGAPVTPVLEAGAVNHRVRMRDDDVLV